LKLTNLFLENFRNYSYLYFSPNTGMNFLYGNNAQGKTSFIEACAYLCLGRSIRGTSDQHLLKFNQGYFNLEGSFKSNDLLQQTTIKYRYLDNNKEKTVSINNLPLNRLIEAVGIQKVVFFLAEHLNIVKGQPNLRRNYLDILIVQVYPKYYQELLDYKKIIQHRNHTLRYNRNSISINLQLEIWEEQLINLAVKIIARRIEFVNFLKKNTPITYTYLTDGKENFCVEYLSPLRFDFAKEFTISELKKVLQDAYQESRKRDLQQGVTTIGPHRDDIFFKINGKDARVFASQGQQKTIALSLKLAEIDFFCHKIKEEPLVLLDDVFSELDQIRQKQLIKYIKKGLFQCFITTTSMDMLDRDWIEGAMVISVENGTISK